RINSLRCSIKFTAKLWEWHTFTSSYTFKRPKDSLREAKTTSRWHCVFKRLNVVYVHHLSFIITCVSHILLLKKALILINRIIELRKCFTHFTTRKHKIELFGKFRITWLCLRQWLHECWHIN